MGSWLKKITIRGVVAAIGFILSPLTLWNDAFVNIPLAAGFAYLVTHTGLIGFGEGFILGYILTNIVGILMLIVGGAGFSKEITSYLRMKRGFKPRERDAPV